MTVEWSGFKVRPIIRSIEQFTQCQATTGDGPNYYFSLPRIVPMDLTESKEKKMGLFNFFVVKKELELEIKNLKSIIEIERKKLQAEYDILATQKTAELVANEKLLKIELEGKLNKQATLYNESLNKLALVHATEVAKLETKLAKEYYGQMTVALRDINLEGSAQTKYIQELSMKMFDKALEKPMPAHMIEERIVRTE